MRPQRRILSSAEVWRLALASVRATRWQTLALVVLGLILPQILVNLGLDAAGIPVAAELRAIFTSSDLLTGSPVPFTQLIAPALSYFGRLLSIVLGLSVPLLASFLALIVTAVDFHRNQPPRGGGRAWAAGLRHALPVGLAMVVGTFSVVVIGQVLLAPALLLAVLATALPAVLVAEQKGVFKSLWSAITIKYARGTGYSPWSILFNLLSISALLYAAFAGIGLLGEGLLTLDERVGLPRSLWVMPVLGTPMTAVYLGTTIIESVLSVLAVAALPPLTTALYFIVRRDAAARPIAQV